MRAYSICLSVIPNILPCDVHIISYVSLFILITIYQLFRPSSFSCFNYPLCDYFFSPFPNVLFSLQCFLLVFTFMNFHFILVEYFSDFQNGMIAFQESVQDYSLRYRKKTPVLLFRFILTLSFKNSFKYT